jgi:hypothetical protein
MVKASLTIGCLIALSACALDPAAGGGATSVVRNGHGNALQARCDRIKVICIDTNVPASLPSSLGIPSVTLPSVPSLLTLPR